MDTHAVVIADSRGVIRVWSDSAEHLFGHSAESAVGQSLDLIVPDAYRARHWARFAEAMSTGVCRLDGAVANIPVTCRDGSVVRFPGRFIFLRDAHDRVVGAMAIFAPNEAWNSESPRLLDL